MPTLVGLGQPIWATELLILLLEITPQFDNCSLQPAICTDNRCCTVPPSATVQRNPSLGSHHAVIVARLAAAANADVLHLTREALSAFVAVKPRAPHTSKKCCGLCYALVCNVERNPVLGGISVLVW